MLGRAKRLQKTFKRYCQTHGYPQFRLDKEEWRQVDYLLCITQPFFKFTTALSKSKDITIHLIFSIYNKLFSHLEASEEQLRRKRIPWKQTMLQALQAAREKLSEYYKMTDHECYSDIYAIATILAPSKKLRFFKTKDWQSDVDYAGRYRGRLEEEFWRYKRRLSDNNSPLSLRALAGSLNTVDEIEMLCDSQNALQPEEPQGNNDDELNRYLAKGKPLPMHKETREIRTNKLGLISQHPRMFWKEHQQEFPILAALARDILSIPASGAGVERLFNYARDICHYRRGQLKSETVKALMLHMCATKFEVEQREIDFTKQLISVGESALLEQETGSLPPLPSLDPISDSEEAEDEDTVTEIPSQLQPQVQSENTRPKRPRSRSTQSQEEVIPEPADLENTQRPSRVRKKTRMPEGFEIGTP